MVEVKGLDPGLTALRHLRGNGDHVDLFRVAADRPFVRISSLRSQDQGRSALSFIDLGATVDLPPGVSEALRNLGWSVGATPAAVTRTYLISSDGDLVRIAIDAHTALDILHPEQFGQRLDGRRFGPYSDSEITLIGCLVSLPSMIVGLVVGSIVLLIWFPRAWENEPAWVAAIIAGIVGTYVIPWVLAKVTISSDRLHDAAQAVQQVGLFVLPALIAAIVLVVATTAF